MQRVTKYPLLLSRLLKVTPAQHKDRNTIKYAKERIEAALEQMNKVSGAVVAHSKGRVMQTSKMAVDAPVQLCNFHGQQQGVFSFLLLLPL